MGVLTDDAFAPGQLPGLLAWWKASDIPSGVDLPVPVWPDSTGNGNYLDTPIGNGPILRRSNGIYYVESTLGDAGVWGLLRSGDLGLSGEDVPMSFFGAAFKVPAADSFRSITALGTSAGNFPGRMARCGPQEVAPLRTHNIDDALGEKTGGNLAIPVAPARFAYVHATTGTVMKGLVAPGIQSVSGVDVNIGTCTFTRYGFGTNWAWRGGVFEGGIFNRDLTDTEMINILNYLRDMYGVA